MRILGTRTLLCALASLVIGACSEAPAPAVDREVERRAVMRVVLTQRYGKNAGKGGVLRFVLDPVLGSGILLLSDQDIDRRRQSESRGTEPICLPDGRRARSPYIEGLEPRGYGVR